MRERTSQQRAANSRQQQVALALCPKAMGAHLAKIAETQKLLKQGGEQLGVNGHPVACHILDAKYEPGKRCAVLYEWGDQMVIGELIYSDESASPPTPSDQHPLADMAIYRYEDDPALPNFTTVLDGEKMAAVFNTNLPECTTGEMRILRCRATPLRYRLGRRCTLRYDLRLRNQQTGEMTKRTLYGKLYHSASKAKAVYGEMQQMSAQLQAEGSALEVADAAAYIPALPMVLQSPVDDSTPLEYLLWRPNDPNLGANSQAEAGTRQAGVGLARLHQSAMVTERMRAVDAEIGRMQKRSAKIKEVDEEMGRRFSELAQRFAEGLEQLPKWGAETSVVHGDCKPSQFYLTESGEAIILDFDHCGMADPAADVGNFLATLRQMGMKQVLKVGDQEVVAAHQRWLTTLEEQFLDAYMKTRNCPPTFRWRAVWYQAVALLRKAIRSFYRSPRSPLPGLLVQEAWRCLEEVPRV